MVISTPTPRLQPEDAARRFEGAGASQHEPPCSSLAALAHPAEEPGDRGAEGDLAR